VLILITRYSLPRVLLAPAGILLTWMAAELSFTGFESRFLRMRDRYWSEKAAPATRAVAEATASETGYGVLEPLPESE
jgi:peptidoglycan/LPS O-acetylase OafA/YrhL